MVGSPIASRTLPQSAQYSASYAYDALNRLTNSPAGNYTYGDSAHLDAATSTSGGYSASYDTSGNMTCRAPSASATCAGSSPTGQQLAYDNEGRLTQWQSTTTGSGQTGTSTTTTVVDLYDGAGQRVLQQSSQARGNLPTLGSLVTTTYVGSLEEVTSSGGTTTTTVSYPGGFAERVNGTISYLASGGLGSPEVALDASGNPQASVLYDPYGNVRYSNGTMPTDLGYTGQHSDASTTGLDYYGARYYDPTIGQFTSADTMLAGGLNRYAYVGGNPETHTDPSGHCEGEDEPDCPVAPEVRDPRNDYESSTNLGCTANCDDVPYGGEISYTQMATDTYNGVYYGPYEAGLTPQMEEASAAERGEFAQEAEAHAQETTHAGDPNGTNGGHQGNSSASSSASSATTAYVADSNVFMDQATEAQNGVRTDILNDPNVTLYVPESAANEVGNRAGGITATEADRLQGYPGGAQVQVVQDTTLSPQAMQTLGSKFDYIDAQVVQAALDRGVPVLTMNGAMERQIASNMARWAIWKSVIFQLIGK